MTTLPSLPLAYAGMALLSLGMDRHARQVKRPVLQRARLLGGLLLAVSLAFALCAPNWRFQLVDWIGITAISAGLVVATLYYRPEWLPRAAAVSAVAGLGTGLFCLF